MIFRCPNLKLHLDRHIALPQPSLSLVPKFSVAVGAIFRLPKIVDMAPWCYMADSALLDLQAAAWGYLTYISSVIWEASLALERPPLIYDDAVDLECHAA